MADPVTPRIGDRADLAARLDEPLREPIVLGARAEVIAGPSAKNNWFSQGLVKPGRKVGAISYPGRDGVGHAWAYLPDVAETVIRLIEREDELGRFELFHFGGHFDGDGKRMIEAIRGAVSEPRLPVRSFPWFALVALSPFVTLFREMREMRYLWQEPIRLDNRRLVAFLGAEPHTPIEVAVRQTLEGLGCLPAAAQAGSRLEAGAGA